MSCLRTKRAFADQKEKEDHHHPPGCSSAPSPSSPTNSSGENHYQTPRSTSTPISFSQAINLDHEYGKSLHSESYKEIWSKIHRNNWNSSSPFAGIEDHHQPPSPSRKISAAQILKPDQEAINEALSSNPNTGTTTLELVFSYFSSSEQVSDLFILLINGVHNARAIYNSLYDVLDLFPGDHYAELTAPQRDYVTGRLLSFVGSRNPLQSPSEIHGFEEMRRQFSHLSTELDRRLRQSQRSHRLLRRIKKGSSLCLIGTTATVAGVAIVVATHALIAVVAAAILCPPFTFAKRKADSLLLLNPRIAQLETVAKGTFVLTNNLITIDRLVTRLSTMFDSDKELVRVALDRAGGDAKYYPMLIQEVVRLMNKNHSSLLENLNDLEEHVCICFASLNRTRSDLIEIYKQSGPSSTS